MVQCELTFGEIRPFVRFAQKVLVYGDKKQSTVMAYDHRLFYVMNGRAEVTVHHTEKTVMPGCLLYWPSGTPYCIQPPRGTVLTLLSFNFDFLQTHSMIVQYLPMTAAQEYVPDKRLESLHFTDAHALNGLIFLTDAAFALPHLNAMVAEATQPELFSPAQLCCLMTITLAQVCRQAAQGTPSGQHGGSWRAILDYIQEHYTENLTNLELGERFNYHPNYISQLIQEHTGVPLHQYLLKVRINQAVHLLQSTDIPISEIAVRVGFRNASYFSQYFKRQTGYTPGSFRVD